jgi:hypothetical protein
MLITLPPRRDRKGNAVLGQREQRRQVEVDHRVPASCRDILGPGRKLPARVVHKDIDTGHLADLRDKAGDGLAVADIARESRERGPGLGGDGMQRLRAAPDTRNLRTQRAEAQRDGPADPGSGPGHNAGEPGQHIRAQHFAGPGRCPGRYGG